MLAVGTFTRLDGIVPGADLVSSSVGSAYAFNSTDGEVFTAQSPTMGSELIAITTDGGPAHVDDALGSGMAQNLSEIYTPIGVSNAIPVVTQVSQQLTAADVIMGDGFGGDGDSHGYTALRGDFQYVDPTPDEPQEFFGGIYLVGAGGGVAAGYQGGWANSTDMHFQVFLNGTIQLAEVWATGRSGGSFYTSRPAWQNSPGTTQWNYTVVIGRDVLANPIVITDSSEQLNLLVTFTTPLAGGDIITFTTQGPNDFVRNELGPGIGSEQFSFGEPYAEGEHTIENAVFGEAINAFGFANPTGTNPLGLPPNGIVNGPAAPGDLDGDGDIDNDDAVIWANDFGNLATGGQSMLMVSTPDDIADGNYSFGNLSLRESLSLAGDANHPGQDTIVFAPWLQHIDLGSPLTVSSGNNVNIIGSGADKLTLDGTGQIFIINSGAAATLRGLHLTGGSGALGGAIVNSGTLTVDYCQIDGNSANVSGGGIFSPNGALVLSNSTISNNSASIQGGGLTLGSAAATIFNSTISSNTAAQSGGGISGGGSNVQVLNSTITANTVQNAVGGGIGSATGMKLRNTIVAGNQAPGPKDLVGFFATTSSYNLIGNDASVGNNIDNGVNGNQVGGEGGNPAINPQLSSLDYHGGTTKTHSLSSISPAIDQGDPNFDPSSFTPHLDYDQRSNPYPRVVDGDFNAIDRVDIGSFEYNPYEFTLTMAALVAESESSLSSNAPVGSNIPFASIGSETKVSPRSMRVRSQRQQSLNTADIYRNELLMLAMNRARNIDTSIVSLASPLHADDASILDECFSGFDTQASKLIESL